jgi:decaprenyl-phosphate phosphoribosyltransferase
MSTSGALYKYSSLVRVDNYLKNIFIFLPLFFKGELLSIEKLLPVAIGFVAFSFIASSVYILNDIYDVNYDRKHPNKKNRPLAAGTITVREATIIGGGLFLAGFILASLLKPNILAILALYAGMNYLYSIKLKHIPIIDICIIALGFVLRLWVGSFAADVTLSLWIIILTFLLALFIALAKRRDDVLLYQENSEKMRKSIDGYNLKFIDSALTIIASVAIVSYLMYVSSAEVIHRVENQNLYVSSFLVIVGFMRYLQITFVEERSGSPVKILIGDIFIQGVLLGWMLFFTWVLYF